MVNSHPLRDITAVNDIHLVIKDGEIMRTGYHSGYATPIPEDREFQLRFRYWIPSEIPTRITSISPRVSGEGSGSFELTVRGHDFTTSSVVQFDGEMLPTRHISSSELRTTVPAELEKRVGTYPVRVHNVPPGWGKTNKANFFVKFN